jgi:hypothetical protein
VVTFPEAIREKYIKKFDISLEAQVTLFVHGNIERRTKDIDVPAEEVRRSLDTPRLALVPFAPHGFVVFGVDTCDPMRTRHVGQYIRVRDVPTLLEEGLTESKADGFTDSAILTVGGGRKCESWQSGAWKVLRIKSREKIGGHLRSQVVHVVCRDHWIERLSVNQFEGPRENPHDHIISFQLLSSPNNRTKPDMSKRTPNVRVDLD